MASSDDGRSSGARLAELSRLADRTLDPRRRSRVEGLIAASPELRSVYERERGVVELLHQVRAADRAPARLRARLAAQRPGKAVRTRRRARYVGALAGALATATMALVLVFPGGTPGSPSVSQAAALATRGASQSAPAPDPSDPAGRLAQRVGGLYFPNWAGTLGWRAAGQRSDLLGGRRAATVYYARGGQRIAYTIVALPALELPRARTEWLNGTEIRSFSIGERQVVTWRRAGHTCVLSGVGISRSELSRLAAWEAPAAAA